MKSIIEKCNEGGPVFTYIILVVLVVILALFIKGIMDKGHNKKTIDFISSFAWFAVAWGFLGRTFGLISAFDAVSASGDLTPSLLADGLKMALLDPLFGIFVFLIARVSIIILIGLQKKQPE